MQFSTAVLALLASAGAAVAAPGGSDHFGNWQGKPATVYSTKLVTGTKYGTTTSTLLATKTITTTVTNLTTKTVPTPFTTSTVIASVVYYSKWEGDHWGW